jgi:UDP-N-acetylmuramyl pentapeptide phosphotransferase/UDP-N-acetylglucosamine-1-phosphate transferase
MTVCVFLSLGIVLLTLIVTASTSSPLLASLMGALAGLAASVGFVYWNYRDQTR